MRRRSRLAFALVAAAATGCPASLDDPSRFFEAAQGSAPCADVPDDLFVPTCAIAGCHNPTDLAQGLDLESPNVAARLVGVRATGGAGMLVDPSQPQQSVLYTKLTFDPPYGARMPFGKEPLDDATIACVLSWIQANVPPSDAAAPDAVAPSDAEASSSDGEAPGDGETPPDDGQAAPDDAMGPTTPEAGSHPAPDAGHPDAGTVEKPDAGVADAGHPASSDASAADAKAPDAG
jgi:hypothetical protein